jgi:hypothetical protein
MIVGVEMGPVDCGEGNAGEVNPESDKLESVASSPNIKFFTAKWTLLSEHIMTLGE